MVSSVEEARLLFMLSPDFTKKDVQRQYLNRSKMFHPDKASPDAISQAEATARFKELVAAKEILLQDAAQRETYVKTNDFDNSFSFFDDHADQNWDSMFEEAFGRSSNSNWDKRIDHNWDARTMKPWPQPRKQQSKRASPKERQPTRWGGEPKVKLQTAPSWAITPRSEII